MKHSAQENPFEWINRLSSVHMSVGEWLVRLARDRKESSPANGKSRTTKTAKAGDRVLCLHGSTISTNTAPFEPAAYSSNSGVYNHYMAANRTATKVVALNKG